MNYNFILNLKKKVFKINKYIFFELAVVMMQLISMSEGAPQIQVVTKQDRMGKPLPHPDDIELCGYNSCVRDSECCSGYCSWSQGFKCYNYDLKKANV